MTIAIILFIFLGTYRVDIEYAGFIVPGSPFFVKTFDPTKVMVTGVKDGVVGKQSSFIGEYFLVHLVLAI